MGATSSAPGLYFTALPQAVRAESVRTDIAAFAGDARRGPVSQFTRVEDWRAVVALFGDLDERFDMPYAVRGYFENGGDIAWIYRMGSDVAGFEQPAAYDPWIVPPLAGFDHARFRMEASSPGIWANQTQVRIHYERLAVGKGRVDIVVEVPGEEVEFLSGLHPETLHLEGLPAEGLHDQINAKSKFLRLDPLDPEFVPPPLGPRFQDWTITLIGGVDPVPGWTTYMNALTVLESEPEPSILAFPDLQRDLSSPADRREFLLSAMTSAEEVHDRLILVDPLRPEKRLFSVAQITGFAQDLSQAADLAGRSGAFYFPHVKVQDPMGGVQQPLRLVPPCGHVAGVISRLDRLRGAHHTPANAELLGVVDLTQSFDLEERGVLNDKNVNLLRCFPGQGELVYGGRTLASDPEYEFLAHRRMVHRLVRTIRRVAEPLVFDVNGPELRLALFRAITTVLLEAYRSGALQGARPDEAFRVQCDDANNPPENVDNGLAVCEVDFAPAVPMEFIHLRVALGREGDLEIFES